MTTAVKTAQNKRKNMRYDCIVPVEGKRGSAFSGSQTVDISRSGAGLIVSKPIPVNTKMAVQLDLTEDGEPIIAIGEVRWVTQLPDSNAYRVGLSFEIPSDSKSRVNSFLK